MVELEESKGNFREILLPKIKSMILATSFIFLFAHCVMFTLFSMSNMTIIVQYEAVSILVYSMAIMFLVDIGNSINSSSNRLLSNIIVVIIIELIIHMILAVVCLGREYNFQLYVFGMLVLVMFEHYISGSTPKSMLLIVFIILSYITCVICYDTYTPLYINTIMYDELERIARVLNPLLVLIFDSWYTLWLSSIIFNYEKIIEKKASFDKLTGLANRRYIDKLSYMGDNTYVAMLDIDNFKQFNDTYGHDIGDLVLKDLGTILRSFKLCTKGFYPIRWGGEEFIIIYNNNSDSYGEFIKILDRLLKAIRGSYIEVKQIRLGYTVTIGVANGIDAKSYEELIKIADERLYNGKNNGKNRIVS